MDDRQVADRVLAGDTDAFEGLVRRYTQHVARIVAGKVPPEASAEVAQDAFVRAFTSLSGWRGDAPFSHWLARLAVRACQDYWRGQYRVKETPISALGQEGRDWLASVDSARGLGEKVSALGSFEARQVLDWALSQLSPAERMVLTLTYLEEKSVKETAELLGISRANVKVRSHRAKRKLAKIISGEVPEGD